jgi:hypothetical protein
MARVAAWTLLVMSLALCVQAQHGAAGAHGSSSGVSAHPGFAGHHFAGGFSSRGEFRHRRDGFVYPYYWPYDYPYDDGDYERPYTEVVERQPAPPTAPLPPPTPPAKAQVIEIPVPANSAAAKPQPPAVFILTNGERLESSRFVLTAANLSVNINRHQRTIPLDQVDLDASVAANRDRGIELRVPADHNEISLSF